MIIFKFALKMILPWAICLHGCAIVRLYRIYRLFGVEWRERICWIIKNVEEINLRIESYFAWKRGWTHLIWVKYFGFYLIAPCAQYFLVAKMVLQQSVKKINSHRPLLSSPMTMAPKHTNKNISSLLGAWMW